MNLNMTPLDIVKRVSNGPPGVGKRYSVPNNMKTLPPPPAVQKNKQMLSMFIKGSNEAKKAAMIDRPVTN